MGCERLPRLTADPSVAIPSPGCTSRRDAARKLRGAARLLGSQLAHGIEVGAGSGLVEQDAAVFVCAAGSGEAVEQAIGVAVDDEVCELRGLHETLVDGLA